jgi:hypothetical protein
MASLYTRRRRLETVEAMQDWRRTLAKSLG